MTGLLLDEMISAAVSDQLRNRGHDAVGLVEDPALRGLPDADVLMLATHQQRVVVTLNVADFVTLDRTWRAMGRRHPGILLISTRAFRQDRAFVGSLVVALDAALAGSLLPAQGCVGFL